MSFGEPSDRQSSLVYKPNSKSIWKQPCKPLLSNQNINQLNNKGQGQICQWGPIHISKSAPCLIKKIFGRMDHGKLKGGRVKFYLLTGVGGLDIGKGRLPIKKDCPLFITLKVGLIRVGGEN